MEIAPLTSKEKNPQLKLKEKPLHKLVAQKTRGRPINLSMRASILSSEEQLMIK
jgi:hypothetical protein